jgi:hypothetical protein
MYKKKSGVSLTPLSVISGARKSERLIYLHGPGLPAACWVKLSGHFGVVHHGMVVLFGFGGRAVADGFEQASAVEPVDPFQWGPLN